MIQFTLFTTQVAVLPRVARGRAFARDEGGCAW